MEATYITLPLKYAKYLLCYKKIGVHETLRPSGTYFLSSLPPSLPTSLPPYTSLPPQITSLEEELAQTRATSSQYEALSQEYKAQLERSRLETEEAQMEVRRRERDMERLQQDASTEMEKVRLSPCWDNGESHALHGGKFSMIGSLEGFNLRTVSYVFSD